MFVVSAFAVRFNFIHKSEMPRSIDAPLTGSTKDIAVVGWACRLPGASSVPDLWRMLLDGRCAITEVPPDRFPLDRFSHPRRQERGRTYTWAAGALDNIWDFDPTVFGISPREAVQMDPQQRILLKLTWEALEDAGVPPSSLAGTETGVYIGACQVEYGHRFGLDHAVADSHFATGTALSIISNRISYVFDLHGPSMTIDTACSSSMVALHEAVEALRAGRIDTAIVGGVNIIESPSSFIAFSQAGMISPRGRCRAFSETADGFVRAEGAGVLVLQHAGRSDLRSRPVHGYVLATEVNSDGRTSGISLPSLEGQHALLERIYGKAGVDPARLAFVEAHGTGTPVGDPIEATALGQVLGVGRKAAGPLLIGSVKTNIGHLEAAAGIGGLFKAFLALKHAQLPASLYFEEPNSHIAFDDLNLRVCTQTLPVQLGADTVAGVNSFGFGGTNAHAIIAPADVQGARAEPRLARSSLFMLSAETRPALGILAEEYATRVAELSDMARHQVAAAAAHRREWLSERAVVTATQREEVVEALKACAANESHKSLTIGQAVGKDLPIAFVYSGNGSQWAGMGRSAYRDEPGFRAHLQKIDGYFQRLSGWSLCEMLFSEDLAEKLALTTVSQPLLFAIQSAITVELKARGLKPSAVFGHSVGEVAAAEAAGILDLETAVKLIFMRSLHQHRTRGTGRMMAVRAPRETIEAIVAGVPGIEVAAFNSPRTATIAGSKEAFDDLAKAFPAVPMLDLGLDYPFHTEHMEVIKASLVEDLKGIGARPSRTRFISTVTGAEIDGEELAADYWWRNVREPVRFDEAVKAASASGIRVFLEIGPRPTLLQHVNHVVESETAALIAAIPSFEQAEATDGVLDKVLARAIVSGAQVDKALCFGDDPGPSVSLPSYPWQDAAYRFQHTTEAFGGDATYVPLVGMRYKPDGLEWYSNIDTALYPQFRDHRVGSRIIFPGTALAEIAIAAGKLWLEGQNPAVLDFELLHPLDLTRDSTAEIRTRISPASNTLEIASRPRLSQSGWTVHVRCRIARNVGLPPQVPAIDEVRKVLSQEEVYSLASDAGLHYGKEFQLVEQITRGANDVFDVALAPGPAVGRYVLDPARADCCAHAIVCLFPELRAKERGVAYIPVRGDRISIFKPYAVPRRAVVEILQKTDQAVRGNYYILDADDQVIAWFQGVRGQAIQTTQNLSLETAAFAEKYVLLDGAIPRATGVEANPAALIKAAKTLLTAERVASSTAVPLEQWAYGAAYDVARALARDGHIDIAAAGEPAKPGEQWLRMIMRRLEAKGDVRTDKRGWSLVAERRRRPATAIQALYKRVPSRAGELALAGWMSGLVDRIGEQGSLEAVNDLTAPDTTADFSLLTNLAAVEGAEALLKLVEHSVLGKARTRALRVLVIGHGRLTRVLAGPAYREIFNVTVFEPNRRAFDRARAALSASVRFKLVEGEKLGEPESYDLVVSAHGLSRLPAGIDIQALHGVVAPGGMIVAIEPKPSFYADFVFGTDPAWFRSSEVSGVESPLLDPRGWERRFGDAGFDDVRSTAFSTDTGGLSLVVAQRGRVSEPHEGGRTGRKVAVVSGTSHRDLASALDVACEQAFGVRPLREGIETGTPFEPLQTIIFLGEKHEDGDPSEGLLARCNGMIRLVERAKASGAQIWMVSFGRLPVAEEAPSAVEAGAWAFSRVLANENPKLDIRRIDVASGAEASRIAEQIVAIVQSGTRETELHVDGHAFRAVRVARAPLADATGRSDDGTRVQLKRRAFSGGRVAWERSERVPPKEGEVEVEVDCAGLNFRDLMWSLGLLPEDMLEGGFAGATLGLECSGRVARIGKSVRGLRVGDRVVALGGNCIASHVVANAEQVAKVPASMSLEAAATIPVAFMTAYYSLVKLANLQRGEWILIHGGAGAVGLAAIQIAKSRGARVIATAGSIAKRSLLTGLGVDHVLDSRSTSFADDTMTITKVGVDVVLNSLAGEAMQASLGCLRPFGRFIELGKRDYVANTNIGLRPFRRNVSYFGVDLDQMVVERPEEATTVFKELLSQLEKGVLTPLPYSTFSGEDVGEALQLMQEALHVGKILVRPPQRTEIGVKHPTRLLNSAGTHVITGAFGGFGMEAARWLADQGVRNLALFGRSGAATPEARSLLEELRDRGVNVFVEPLDVSDEVAVRRTFDKLSVTLPPVVGILHAAMVLEDGIVTSLDDGSFRRVFAPKVTGSEILDDISRKLDLDYFVFFSSITTVAGHHGQGNYVAANAYMEGLARRRRKAGLPGVAICWGVISDVGVAALNEKARTSLAKLAAKKGLTEEEALSLVGMRAREALELLGQTLARGLEPSDPPAIILSAAGGQLRRDFAPILKSPTFDDFVTDHERDDSGLIDLRAMLLTEDIEVVRKKLTQVVVQELAKVLHTRPEDVSVVRPLKDLGLDSLMALELAMDLEGSMGVDFALAQSVGSLTVRGLVDEILANATAEPQVASVEAKPSTVEEEPGKPEKIERTEQNITEYAA